MHPNTNDDAVLDPILADPNVLLDRAFKGVQKLHGIGLSKAQAQQLTNIGIDAIAGDKVTHGLISTTTYNNCIDLVSIYLHINRVIENIGTHYLMDQLNKYHDELSQIQNHTMEELEWILERKTQALTQLGLAVLPIEFIYSITYPKYFLKYTAPYIGDYTYHTHREISYMFSYELDLFTAEVERERESIEFLHYQTPREDLFYSTEEETPPPTSYPNVNNTRRFNNIKTGESKSRLAHTLYLDIKCKLSSMSSSEKKRMECYIRSLRPPIATLKAHYLNKGDSQEIVDKLVTPENYPYLPNVWINKYQQQVLLDVLNGQEHLHNEYITNGFRKNDISY